MRFAEFWYAGNGRFTALKEFCSELAETSGLKLEPEDAFYWLATGGFAQDTVGIPAAATFPIVGVKHIASQMLGKAPMTILDGQNVVVRRLEGSREVAFANYHAGTVQPIPCLARGDSKLPVEGAFHLVLLNTAEPIEIDRVVDACIQAARKQGQSGRRLQPQLFVDAIEALVAEGWLMAGLDPTKPASQLISLAARGQR
jgi:hypothetical protein